LAGQAEQLFNLKPESVHVIPYPLGHAARIQRRPAIWQRDSLCFVGRLELRKGIVELVDAAVNVAKSRSSAVFDFIGSDTSLDGGAGRSVREYLTGRIPRSLRSRFHFRGALSREELMQALANASAAVVPSRWENLPYSCIEAMATGLPVLVSPHGGMAELVESGHSGWLAANGTAAGLAAALFRVLDTPASQRAQMGQNAAAAVRRICSNATVVERQIDLRSRLLSGDISCAPGINIATTSLASEEPRRGLAVVITCLHPELVPDCLDTLKKQSQQPLMVIVVGNAHVGEVAVRAGVEFIESRRPVGPGREAAIKHVMRAAPRCRGVVFLNESVRIEPPYLKVCESLFEKEANVGIVSSFVSCAGTQDILQMASTHVSLRILDELDNFPCASVRAEALDSFEEGRTWVAVTYPEVLASAIFQPHRRSAREAGPKKRYSGIALAQQASAGLALSWFLAASWRAKAKLVGRALSQPRRTAHWVGWRFRAVAMRAR
jgi:hypothetical protein